MAVLRPTGEPEILNNADGDATTPNVVLFQDFGDGDEPVVGSMAKHQAATAPMDVVQFVKRQMGDPHWRFDAPSGATFTAEEISAIILKRLKQDAELALDDEVTDAVITVPAYFDDARRTATRQAGKIAGLASNRTQFERFQREGDAVEAALSLLRLYVWSAIVRPFETERTFWSLSAMPATNRRKDNYRLAALSINKMETMWMQRVQFEGDDFLLTFFNVSKSAVVDEYGSVSEFERQLEDLATVTEPGYESGGDDVLGVNTIDPIDGGLPVRALLVYIRALVRAARDLNLRLMRKGPTLQWRYHNFSLADEVLYADDSDWAKIDAALPEVQD